MMQRQRRLPTVQPQQGDYQPLQFNYDGKRTKSEWYVFTKYYHNGIWVPRKFREGINYIKDRQEKIEYGKALMAARQTWLENGWNPVTDPEFKQRNNRVNENTSLPESKDQIKKMAIVDALTWAAANAEVSKDTKRGYKSQIALINKSVANAGYALHPITRLDTFTVKAILKQMKNDRQLSDHAHNKYRGMLSIACMILKEWEIMTANPVEDVKKIELNDSDMYVSFTEAEKKRIEKHLTEVHWRFFVLVLTVYHGGLRIKEALGLKVGDINLAERVIKIVPEEVRENSKTTNIRMVGIDDHFFQWLKKLDLANYPADYYVFGSPFAPGQGNKGSLKRPKGSKKVASGVVGAMRPDYFSPSLTRVKRDTATRLWNELVMQGLGINKYLYAAKFTGGDDKIRAGVDLDALRNQYGHRNKRMSEHYAKEVLGVYRKEIITKTRAFTGKLPK